MKEHNLKILRKQNMTDWNCIKGSKFKLVFSGYKTYVLVTIRWRNGEFCTWIFVLVCWSFVYFIVMYQILRLCGIKWDMIVWLWMILSEAFSVL